ncbi:MAG TPA: c-type cytochrome [Chitinophagaceae bacterium]|nr:c-type cytochrome [Chitinophagaceae bacterium]
MHLKRTCIVIASMALLVTTGVAFTAPPDDNNGYKNLKILPKDISKENLGKVMHGFNDALGVKCGFCHAPSKDTAVHHPDFASDEKPEKEIARSMMKMTLKINKKFFSVKHPSFTEQMEVSCGTCHHGEAHPEAPEAK